MQKLKFACLALCAFPTMVCAEIDTYSLSLEELLNIPVTVSSRKALSQRKTPGIVTVISAEEIKYSGARDLVDVLRLVPGMDIRVTVNNGLSLGMRGHIGSDGRILMLVDGIEVNDHRYGGVNLGQGFPVEQIARIEIIRGSALALYGGTALLGVVNIISKSAEELDGVQVGAGIGRAQSGVNSSEYASVMAGSGLDSPVKLTAMAHVGKSLRSDRTFQDVNGGSFDMAHANASRPGFVNIGLQKEGFSARYLHEDSTINDRDGVNTVRAADYRNIYYSDALLLQQRIAANAELKLTPSLLVQQENPRKTVKADGSISSEVMVDRVQVKLPFAWDVNEAWNLAGGVEYLDEKYRSVVRPFPLRQLPFDSTQVASLYGEAMAHHAWGDITASMRVDDHSHAGVLRAERVGYTRIMGDWHVKFMGSHARRAPSIESYAARPSPLLVKPEAARTWEMETGYRIGADAQVSINLFDITTLDTLVLTNMQKVHTRGMETGYKIRKEWGYADVSYSYYDATGTDTPYVMVMPDPNGSTVVDGSKNLAFPAHKLTADLHYKLRDGMSIDPSLVYLGPRWGMVAPNPGTGGTLKHFSAIPIVNVALNWEHVYTKGLDLTLAMYNVLNKEVDYISPMNSYHAPLPGMSREVMLHAQYKF